MARSEPTTSEGDAPATRLAAGDNPPERTAVMPVWNEGERVVPTIRAFAAAVAPAATGTTSTVLA